VKKVIVGFLTSILLAACFPSIAIGQHLIDKPPSDISTFRNTIEKSLVSFSCANESGIAFSGNWTVSEENVNQGINSSFFTSGVNLGKCGRYDSTFDINYLNKNYTAKIWNAGDGYPDFGGFNSSLKLPTLSLWGSNAPDVGSWVTVVRSAPGFGFIWSESKVRLYNPETLIFAIDVLSPSIDKNALVFNNLGEFIGVVSTYATKQVDGFVTVHGAPLQCKLNKTQTTPSVTKCSDFAQDIWKSHPSELALDAENATSDALSTAYQESNDATQAAQDALFAVQALAVQVYEMIKSFIALTGAIKKLK